LADRKLGLFARLRRLEILLQRVVLAAAPYPIGAGMNTQRSTNPAAGARALVAAVTVSLADLKRATGGLSPLEQAEAERIRHACQRLLQCAEELSQSALVVAGSMKQTRVHPLVRTEQELRREITDALRKLSFLAVNRAASERINAYTRDLETPAEPHSEGKR
jgi:hypothetical protein